VVKLTEISWIMVPRTREILCFKIWHQRFHFPIVNTLTRSQ